MTVFDAASWNGVAIDLMCGGHGTCKSGKCTCRLRARAAQHDRSAGVHHGGAEGRLAARLPLARTGGSDDRSAAAPVAPEGCARRRRTARDPATGSPEALPGALRAELEDQTSDLERRLRERTTSSCGFRWRPCARSPDVARSGLEGHGRDRRRRPDRRRARRHVGRHALAFDLGTTTVVATLINLETGYRKRCSRSSTSSSRSAPTSSRGSRRT